MSFSEITAFPTFWIKRSPRSVVSKLSAKFEHGIWAAPHLLCLYLHNYGVEPVKNRRVKYKAAFARQINVLVHTL